MSRLSDIIANAPRPLTGRREFVLLMAGAMSLNALAIDVMLPALERIALGLDVSRPNDRQ